MIGCGLAGEGDGKGDGFLAGFFQRAAVFFAGAGLTGAAMRLRRVCGGLRWLKGDCVAVDGGFQRLKHGERVYLLRVLYRHSGSPASRLSFPVRTMVSRIMPRDFDSLWGSSHSTEISQ